MESLAFLRPAPFAAVRNPTRFSPPPQLPTSNLGPSRPRRPHAAAALKSSRGFGPQKTGKSRKRQKQPVAKEEEEEGDDDVDDGDDDEETIPEVVTNRMMRRMGATIGIPLAVGLLFFPFFYYLKAVAKVDVPSWVPFLVSFFFFGASLLGVSYGIVSASWDPLREGSFLGWTEAQRNWPVFWQSLRGGKEK